jgi:hypothetical protein
MLPYAAYSHAYICHSHSCAYICIRIRIRIWAMAIATAMAMPGGWARCRGAAIIQRGVGQAGEADNEASWGQRKQVTRMRIAGRGRGFKRSACALTELVHRPPAAPGAMCRCGRVAVQRSAYGCGTELVALPSMCQIRTSTPIDVDMQVAMATVWGTTCDPHAGLEASWCLPNDAIATVHGQGAIALLHVDDMSRCP